MAAIGSTAAAQKGFSLAPYSYAEARALADALGVAEPVAVTLVRRGYRTVEAARAFLAADVRHDPYEFEAMSAVVERLRAAVTAGHRITVHGDYDVDGVSATAILVRTLRALGADCDWFIPDRLGGGYGLTTTTVEALAARGTRMLVTVDCGITCPVEIEVARGLGIEAIVTDHHQPDDSLPDCPILHPEISGYPCRELCATGVAYKIATALRGDDAESELDLVALATVADLVPLQGENRALVRRGLEAARRARRPGLRALMASAGVRAERLDEGDLAFRLAPRINAAGRLYRADAGVELMLTESEQRAGEIAAELERANGERRAVENEVLAGAERALRELGPDAAEAPALVLAGEGWHPGVVGIVASRLVESHHRPVVLVGLDGAGRGRGSGRSIPGFDLLAALRACDEHLLRYGGHRAAAGVELEAGSVEGFRAAFVSDAAAALEPADLVRTEDVDAVVGAESLGHDVAEQLARLGPFGIGNPGVRLLVPAARLGDVRPMGRGDRHARFTLASGPRRALGVAFGVNGELAAATESEHDVSVRLELNEWNGAVEPRVVLGDLYPQQSDDPAPAHAGPASAPGEREFWRRVDAELAVDLDDWPLPAADALASDPSRELVDRTGGSGIAAVAALASSGESVLVVCADALRRRELVERAVCPARFGGGAVALCSLRLSATSTSAVDRVRAGAGIALADWGALAAYPEIARGFVHVVICDPAPFAHLDAISRRGEGYLHLLPRPDERELSLRVLAEEWPGRDSVASIYRALRRSSSAGPLSAAEAHTTLSNGGFFPRAPEIVARALRVLAEIGHVRWSGSGADRALGVVSSGGADLDRSAAFIAFRRRFAEGERYLTEAT